MGGLNLAGFAAKLNAIMTQFGQNMTDLMLKTSNILPSIMAILMRPLAALYTRDKTYEGLFLIDTDEGLRRNMMRTTLEIITTYLSDRDEAANRVIGAYEPCSLRSWG